MSAHRKEKSLTRTSARTKLVLEGPEARKEPPQEAEEPTTRNLIEGLEVRKESPQINDSSTWKIYVDGMKNNLGVGTGIVLKSLEGTIFMHYIRLNFLVTNNKVEYEAFIAGLRSASKLKVFELHIFNDSKLVVKQVTGKFEARGPKMAKFLAITKTLLTKLRVVKIEWWGGI